MVLAPSTVLYANFFVTNTGKWFWEFGKSNKLQILFFISNSKLPTFYQSKLNQWSNIFFMNSKELTTTDGVFTEFENLLNTSIVLSFGKYNNTVIVKLESKDGFTRQPIQYIFGSLNLQNIFIRLLEDNQHSTN